MIVFKSFAKSLLENKSSISVLIFSSDLSCLLLKTLDDDEIDDNIQTLLTKEAPFI